jgi:hypothetical protein
LHKLQPPPSTPKSFSPLQDRWNQYYAPKHTISFVVRCHNDVSLINNFQKCKISQIYATYFESGPRLGGLRGAHRGNMTTLVWIVGSGYTILPNIGGPAFPFLLRFSRKRRIISGEEKPHPKKPKEKVSERHSYMMCSSP